MTRRMDDDMMATPLGKLPPPVVQNNKDIGPVTAPSYDELRNSVSIPRAEDNAFQSQGQYDIPPQQPQFQYQQQQAPPPTPRHYDPVPPPPATYQPIQPQYDYPSLPPLPPPKLKKKRRSSFFSMDTLKREDVWLVAAITFGLLTYGVPKLRSSFPSIVDPTTGATKTLPLAAMALAAGILFRLGNTFVEKHD